MMTPTIDVAVKDLTTVSCPKCSNPLVQTNLMPGAASRHRCRRCDEWVVVIVVEAPAAAVEAAIGVVESGATHEPVKE